MGIFKIIMDLFKIPEKVRQYIDDQIKKKKDKAQDQAGKDINKQFNDVNKPDPKKPAEPPKDDVGANLEKIIEEAMRAHTQASAAMQDSINKLRGFAPSEINYPSDTDSLVKKYISENGGQSNASIDALRNTGYLMQGQQNIGQAIQFNSQALVGMAQNMDQSFQGAMDFMQEVPETVNEAVERQEDGLEDFLKQWRKGQDKQFKLFSILKGAAVKPFEIAKIGMSAAERATATMKMVKESVEQALGKGAAFKVIFKQLADAFPFIGKIRDKIIDFENLIPNLTAYLGKTFKHISGKISALSFSVKGAILSGLTHIEFGNIGRKVREALSQEDQQLIKDYDAISATKELNQAISARVDFANATINDIERGEDMTISEETRDRMRAGDLSTLFEEIRSARYQNDPKRQAAKVLDQIAYSLEKKDDELYDLFNVSQGGREHLAKLLHEYVESKDWGDDDSNKNKIRKDRTKALKEYVKKVKDGLKDPEHDGRAVILEQIQEWIKKAGNDDPLEQYSAKSIQDEYALSTVNQAVMDAFNKDIEELKANEDVEARNKALKKYNFTINEKGQIDTAEEKADWTKIRDENRETVKQGVEDLERLMGKPSVGNARAHQFIQDMLLKYQLEFRDDPDFIKTYFWADDWENVKKIRINDEAMTKWLKQHPEIGYTTEHTTENGNVILSEQDQLEIYTNGGNYSNIHGKGDKYRITRNQGTNAWREFDNDGSSTQLPKLEATQEASPIPPLPPGELIDEEPGEITAPKVKTVTAPAAPSNNTSEQTVEDTIESAVEDIIEWLKVDLQNKRGHYDERINAQKQSYNLLFEDAQDELKELAQYKEDNNGNIEFLKGDTGEFLAKDGVSSTALQQASDRYKVYNYLRNGRLSAETRDFDVELRALLADKNNTEKIIRMYTEKIEGDGKEEKGLKGELIDLNKKLDALATLITLIPKGGDIYINQDNSKVTESPDEVSAYDQ